MIKLQKKYIGTGETKDFVFIHMMSNDYAFIYEVRVPSDDNKSIKVHYEVFERKISKENDSIMKGVKVHFDEREIYPKANSFGVWAWTYSDYDKAKIKFNQITENAIESINKQKLTQ